MGSLYRAGGLVSVVGLGIALSFAAYLLGTLSTSALTPLLRRLFPRAKFESSEDETAPTLAMGMPRAPLSPQAGGALRQIVRTAREQLESSLALTEDVYSFLNRANVAKVTGAGASARVPITGGKGCDCATQGVGHWSRLRIRCRSQFVVPALGLEGPPVDIVKVWLARAVLADLDVVARTRLLGRDQELYSAVDRNRAEAEFRLAVAPPLVFLGISLGARSSPWILAILAPLGLILAWALFMDAVRSEQMANEILLDSIADGRVQSPTLERLEAQAAAIGSPTPLERMSTAVKDAGLGLQEAVRSAESAAGSDPASVRRVRQRVEDAQQRVDRVRAILPPPVVQTAEETLRYLHEWVVAWEDIIAGRHPEFDTQAHLDRARQLLADFQGQAGSVIEQAGASASEPAHRAEDPP
jgi:hypothetical protein